MTTGLRGPIYTEQELADIVRCSQAMEADPWAVFVFGSYRRCVSWDIVRVVPPTPEERPDGQ